MTLTVFPDFMRTHPQYFARDNALNFVSDDGGDSYNLCHCPSRVPRVLCVS
jgi:hypothetical protein